MANTQMPHIPGAGVMTDTLDFVKNLWGSMSVPGLTAPTLSVDELDKKINDCLLYTSPSPRDRQKSRMPSSA